MEKTKLGIGIRLLETLTSALYEDPVVLFREYVQNSIDSFKRSAGNQHKIEINIDRKSKNITILDDGDGIPKEQFENKMNLIAGSDKSGELDQIGFRGIGRLSAMPFCTTLRFINKAPGETSVQRFEWNGKKYKDMLLAAKSKELEDIIGEITSSRLDEKYEGDEQEHFFKVEIIGYNEEIDLLVEKSKVLKEKLKLLLPLKYAPDFEFQDIIHEHYRNFMGGSLEDFEADIFLDGEPLYKPYANEHILESDIIFWDLRFFSSDSSLPDDKVGVLWFTFNRKIEAAKLKGPRGIYVRSKNMLLGDETAITNAIKQNGADYISTHREIEQTVQGVYGEILLNNINLSDNARRDWFKLDKYAAYLNNILIDFLKKLYNYRYAASKMFNDKANDSKKEENVIKAFDELTNGISRDTFVSQILKSTKTKESSSELKYAEEDIPNQPITVKKIYESILQCIHKYYINEKSKDFEEFLKLRAYLKKNYKK